MRSMSKKPDAYLKPRGSNKFYSVVVSIPEELRSYYPKKNGSFKDKIIKSLGTNNLIKARMLRDKHVAEIFIEFEDLRNASEKSKASLAETIEIQLDAINKARLSGDQAGLSGLQTGLEMIRDLHRDNPSQFSKDEDHIRLAAAVHKAYNIASISHIAEEYIKYHHDFSDSMKQKMRRYAKELIEFVGHDIPPARLTTSQARAFIRQLNEQTNRGHKVKKDTAGGLSKLWAWSKRHELVSDNVFEGAREDIHVGKRGKAKPRYPFSNQDVVAVLEGILILDIHQKMLSSLSLMSLYTGARISELTGLRVEHILEDHVLDIAEGKNKESVRRIPTDKALHPLINHLVETSSDGWLIPDIPNGKTTRAAYASNAFSKFKQSLWGHVARPEITFHSFRHRMEDLFRDADIQLEIRHRLTGRKDQGSEGDYGKGVTIEKMKRALNTIQQGDIVEEAVQKLLLHILYQ